MREWRRGKSYSLSYIFQTLFFDNLIVQSCVVEEGYGTKMSTSASKADPSAKRPSDSFFLKDRGVCLPSVGCGGWEQNTKRTSREQNRTPSFPSSSTDWVFASTAAQSCSMLQKTWLNPFSRCSCVFGERDSEAQREEEGSAAQQGKVRLPHHHSCSWRTGFLLEIWALNVSNG